MSKNTIGNIEKAEISLSNIHSIHHRYKSLLEVHPVPSRASFHADDFTVETLSYLLALNPIVVRESNSKFYCVGNIHLYQLACVCLTEDTTIPVLKIKNKKLAEIDKLFWAEHLLLPVINHLGPKQSERLTELWVTSRNESLPWKKPVLKRIKTKSKFKRLLNR